VWGGGPIVFQKCKNEGGSFNLLMDECLNRPSKEDMELMAVICKRIWLRRNKMVFDQIFTPPMLYMRKLLDPLKISDYVIPLRDMKVIIEGELQPQFLLLVGKLLHVVRLKLIEMPLSIRAWISLGLEW
jgi:hypothetical protein